jgi:hypothetical protein
MNLLVFYSCLFFIRYFKPSILFIFISSDLLERLEDNDLIEFGCLIEAYIECAGSSSLYYFAFSYYKSFIYFNIA